jgi:GNAT superfamily N-acetyltransferase
MERNQSFVIRHITQNDIENLTKNFAPYNKEQGMYDRFWLEHQLGKRVTLVAIAEQEAVGYTNILRNQTTDPSGRKAFQHVIDEYQQQGIGTALIKEAERIATARDKKKIGIGVDLNAKDTPAQRLYPKLGYEPVSGESIPRPVFTLCKSRARLLNAPNGSEGIRQVDHATFIDSISERLLDGLPYPIHSRRQVSGQSRSDRCLIQSSTVRLPSIEV